jgi:hypothetical protein
MSLFAVAAHGRSDAIAVSRCSRSTVPAACSESRRPVLRVLPRPRLTRTAPRASSGHTHRPQHMRRLRVGARTGGAAGDRVAGTVELADQRFAIDSGRQNKPCSANVRRLAEERRAEPSSPVRAASRSRVSRAASAARRSTANSQATPKPTIAATFSVPERKAALVATAGNQRLELDALVETSAAAPLGPPILCADRSAHARRPH